MRIKPALLALAIAATVVPGAAPASEVPAPPTAQDRSVDPVVLTGAQFPQWSAGKDPTFRTPQVADDPTGEQSDCAGAYDDGQDHNCYQESQLPRNPLEGTDVDRLLGYRWDPQTERFEQIPFQVDERFTRYLTNNVSGFAFYSGADAHNTYAFDREGWRFQDNEPDNVCKPRPIVDPHTGERQATTPDPVVGLDDDDELAFMWRDTGAQAPPASALPEGIVSATEVAIADPSNPENVRFAYVMETDGSVAPAFTAGNSPYVSYERDADADLFVYSQSSYSGYGLAKHGPHCDRETGEPVRDGNGELLIRQRRPLDTAWIKTPRYAFRYEGRWLMTELHVSDDASGDWTYGPDVIDRWKARAFQQDPSSDTPCCGYEEEDTNWGGSSILMGELAGPVRVIRETWGADSSTNNARREIFYRDMFVWGDSLRVHPIPPLDGIYSQWDYNAGIMTRYFNPMRPDGVAIDGQNDEVFGNLDDPCNPQYDGRGSDIDEFYRERYRDLTLCENFPYHQSVDLTDPTHSFANALQWEQVAGPHGTVVTRTVIREHTVGGDAQSTLFAVPYYRDDSCFDDGTGTDPGPRRRERRSDETKTYRLPGGTEDLPRSCWSPSDGLPDTGFTAGVDERGLGDEFGDERYFQGSIGTHGVHLLLVAESDNLYATVPLTEIVSEQRVVVLPSTMVNVGERYGRFLEFPLSTAIRPYV